MSVTNSIIKVSKSAWQWIKIHKSTIMVCGGVCLYGKALYDTGKQTYKAVRAIDEINTDRMANGEDPLTKKEAFKQGVSYYIQPGLEAIAATVLVIGGYKIAIDKLLTTSAGAKLVSDKYESLTHTIDEYFGDDVEEKDKFYSNYHRAREERIYGDGNEPIDRYSPRWSESGYSKLIGTNPNVGKERYKDFVGTNMYVTRGDIRAAIIDIRSQLKGGNDVYLSDFYDALPDGIEYPRVCNKYLWEGNMFDSGQDIDNIDIVFTPDQDSEGLFYQMTFTGTQPEYIG